MQFVKHLASAIPESVIQGVQITIGFINHVSDVDWRSIPGILEGTNYVGNMKTEITIVIKNCLKVIANTTDSSHFG